MGGGALSDPRVVEASLKVDRIIVDGTDRTTYRAVFERFGVRSMPTIIFLDKTGAEVGRPPFPIDADALLQNLASLSGGPAPSSMPLVPLLVMAVLAAGAIAGIVWYVKTKALTEE